jgi:hypothetical protein
MKFDCFITIKMYIFHVSIIYIFLWKILYLIVFLLFIDILYYDFFKNFLSKLIVIRILRKILYLILIFVFIMFQLFCSQKRKVNISY